MPNAAIIGAGLIGRAWASIFARGGWDVAIWDPMENQRQAAHALVRAQLDDMAQSGLADDPAAASARVKVVTTLAEAVSTAGFVQECGPEMLDAKRALFADLDKHAKPGVVLASSTSAIVASLFTEHLPGRDRCLGK